MPHTLRSALDEYRRAEEFARLAPSSQKLHLIWLNAALDVVDPKMAVAKLGRADIDAVLHARRSSGCSAATLNSNRMVLRCFCKWLVSVGYLKKNPALHLRNEKRATPASKRRPITTEQFKTMVEIAEGTHPRDAALVTILFFTGARSAELMGLTWRDVDFDRRRITITRSKVHDVKVLAMPGPLAQFLKLWRENFERLTTGEFDLGWYVVPPLASKVSSEMNPEWPLNPTRSIGTYTMRCVVKRLLYLVGETDLEGRACHTLRRSAANALVDATGDIRAAQHLLGHASVTQTEAYLDRSAIQQKYDLAIEDWEI